MEYPVKLIPGILIRRYKRFLADVQLINGDTIVAHCTNTGSMKGCIEKGAPVYLSPANSTTRKTQYTWELIQIDSHWIGVNTQYANVLAANILEKKMLTGLNMYTSIKREVRWGNSRFDIMAQNDTETCYIEVKNVTMKRGKASLFPDAVTTRGKKHLETLIEVKKHGFRAVMLYIIQRNDTHYFSVADDIDPLYGIALRKAIQSGVEVFAVNFKICPQKIEMDQILPVKLQ